MELCARCVFAGLLLSSCGSALRKSDPESTLAHFTPEEMQVFNKARGKVKVRASDPGDHIPFYDHAHHCLGPTFAFYHGYHTGAITFETAVRYSFNKMELNPCSGIGHAFKKPPKNLKANVIFTLVRDPWSRILSSAARTQSVDFGNDRTDEQRITDFRNWVMSPHWERDSYYLDKDHLIDYVVPNRTHIIRMTNFEEDFVHVCTLLGVIKPFSRFCSSPNWTPRHCSRTCRAKEMEAVTHDHFAAVKDNLCVKDYYDDATREKVANRFKDDIEYFSFKFGELC